MQSSLGKMGPQKPKKKYPTPNPLKPIMCFGFGNYPWIPAVWVHNPHNSMYLPVDDGIKRDPDGFLTRQDGAS